MRLPVDPVVLIIGISLAGLSQTSENRLRGSTSASTVIEQCPVNPDPLYDRKRVLEQLANVLNASAPGFRKYEDDGFRVKDEKPEHFFIFDLIDPANKSTPSTGCINFLNNHIYHFAARYVPFSFSHVLILEDGQLKFFKAINCKNSKDTIDDVAKHVEKRLNVNDKDEVIQRIRDYRKYGEYFTVDDTVIRCGQ